MKNKIKYISRGGFKKTKEELLEKEKIATFWNDEKIMTFWNEAIDNSDLEKITREWLKESELRTAIPFKLSDLERPTMRGGMVI